MIDFIWRVEVLNIFGEEVNTEGTGFNLKFLFQDLSIDRKIKQ